MPEKNEPTIHGGDPDVDALFEDLLPPAEDATPVGIVTEDDAPPREPVVEPEPEEEEEETSEVEEEEESSEEGEEEEVEEDPLSKEIAELREQNALLIEAITRSAAATAPQEDAGPQPSKGASVTSYGVTYDMPDLPDDEFEEILQDKGAFLKFIHKVATEAAAVERENALLGVGERIDARFNAHSRVAKFFRDKNNADLASAGPGVKQFILKRAAQIEGTKSGEIEDFLGEAANEVRNLLKITGGAGSDPRSSKPKRGAFAPGTKKAKRPEVKIPTAEDQLNDDLNAMLKAGM